MLSDELVSSENRYQTLLTENQSLLSTLHSRDAEVQDLQVLQESRALVICTISDCFHSFQASILVLRKTQAQVQQVQGGAKKKRRSSEMSLSQSLGRFNCSYQ